MSLINGDVELSIQKNDNLPKIYISMERDERGSFPVITIRDNTNTRLNAESGFWAGYFFGRGYKMQGKEHLISRLKTDEESKAVIIDAGVFITNKDIFDSETAIRILNSTQSDKCQGLLVVANNYSEEALSTLLSYRTDLPCVPVMAPGFGDRRRQMLEDISLVTHAPIITDLSPASLSQLNRPTAGKLLGHAGLVVVKPDICILTLCPVPQDEYEKRLDIIMNDYHQSTSEYDLMMLLERYETLNNGVLLRYE